MNFVIDFSKTKIVLPKAETLWQQEILDFIKLYQNNDKISVKTSGSTGKPKEIVLHRKAMQQSAHMTAGFLDLKEGESALLCLPVQYIAGKMMIVRAIEIGMQLYCVQPKTKIEFEKEIDFCAMTPMQAEASIFENKETPKQVQRDSLQIKKLILGGAKVSQDLESKLKNIPTEAYETYGMTETITHIAMRKLNEQTYFHTLKNIEIQQDARECLIIKTPYFEDKIITNDVVELKDENKFKLLGRVDNIINSGGIKINPESVEEKLKPFIQKPFIIHHKKDEKLGQKVVLVIESNTEFEVNYPLELIPKNQQPKEVIFIEEFPRTLSGKIKRKEIKL